MHSLIKQDDCYLNLPSTCPIIIHITMQRGQSRCLPTGRFTKQPIKIVNCTCKVINETTVRSGIFPRLYRETCNSPN